MNNKNQSTNDNTSLSNDDYNSLPAIEHVYPADIIDCTEYVNSLANNASFDSQQEAANDAFVSAIGAADVYSLNSMRMAKHNQSLDRRSSKSKLTDRRLSARLSADGEFQVDRRADNRAANIESIRLSHNGISSASPSINPLPPAEY